MARLVTRLVACACASSVVLAKPYTITDPKAIQEKWFNWNSAADSWNSMTESLTAATDSAGEMFTNAHSTVSGAVSDAHATVSGAVGDAHKSLSELTAGQPGFFTAMSDTVGQLQDMMTDWKNDAIKGMSSLTGGACDSLREATGNAEAAIEADIKQQGVTPIDFSGQASGVAGSQNPCLATVEEDIKKEVTAQLGTWADNAIIKESVGWMARAGSDVACVSQQGLSHIDLSYFVDTLCPAPSSRLFTVFGHPLFERNSPSAAVALCMMVAASAGLVMFVRRAISSHGRQVEAKDVEAKDVEEAGAE